MRTVWMLRGEATPAPTAVQLDEPDAVDHVPHRSDRRPGPARREPAPVLDQPPAADPHHPSRKEGTPMAVISVDAGTTMIKAVGYDNEGTEVVVVRQATTVSRPRPVGPSRTWSRSGTPSSTASAASPTSSANRVDYVAITAQGDGSWLVDAAGAPTGPAILWNDGRAADIVEVTVWRGRRHPMTKAITPYCSFRRACTTWQPRRAGLPPPR